MDALRLDAIHGIMDVSAYPFLSELADTVRGLAERTDRMVNR
jgi:maltooligosyltrehalose trehalohydrolase